MYLPTGGIYCVLTEKSAQTIALLNKKDQLRVIEATATNPGTMAGEQLESKDIRPVGLVYHTRFGNGVCAYHNSVTERNGRLYMLVGHRQLRDRTINRVTFIPNIGHGEPLFHARPELGRAHITPRRRRSVVVCTFFDTGLL